MHTKQSDDLSDLAESKKSTYLLEVLQKPSFKQKPA
jgi:hypothetical protein